MTLYLDLDGVLADFDKAAGIRMKTDNIYKYEFVWGTQKFWDKINGDNMFFLNLEKMPDAGHLWAKVQHLNPVILTALPKTDYQRVDVQKRAWVRKHFGETKVLTCQTTDKPTYCLPGDILIDDRAVNRDAWLAQGGTYIIHTSAQNTLTTMKALGYI